MSVLSLIGSGPEDGSLSLEELTTFLCCSLDALHSKVCGVFMMIAVLHTMEITGNHMFFYQFYAPPHSCPLRRNMVSTDMLMLAHMPFAKVYMR